MYDALREAWSEVTAEGAPFEIETIEVRGQRLRAFKNAPGSLRDVWLASGAHAESDAIVFQDERWTYAEAHASVASIANWYREQGLVSGDRIAIAMRNYPEWMLAYWAAQCSGIAVVGMNAWWTGPEMEFAIEDSEPKILICDQERLANWLPSREKAPGMKLVGARVSNELPAGVTPWSDLIAEGGALPAVEVDPDSDACIFYTSGTTGRPKGAQLTHRGCTNNLMSIGFWNATQALAKSRIDAVTGNASAAAAGGGEPPAQLAFLSTTPLFHVTANNCLAQPATLSGSKLVLMYKWDAGDALRIIEAEKITNLSGVPVMSRELLAHPDFEKHDTSSLKALGGGGAQLQPDLVKEIDGKSGAAPSTGYGMTETCGIITANGGDFFVDKAASAGPVMPSFEAKCVNDRGETVAPGEVGELWVKGAQVIRGYLNRPEATAEEITDGWLHTGDVARIDEDGFVFIVDRAKDMVLRGGENVYCAEVESAIFEHPLVRECAVFSVPDDRLGEEVGAAVFLSEKEGVTADALRAFCQTHLAKHKLPRYVWFLDESIPRNASGKFLKRALRDRLDPADAS
ncbi:MAG: class I adenylate-forming enzyme family protein [Myxococcota bacterium]